MRNHKKIPTIIYHNQTIKNKLLQIVLKLKIEQVCTIIYHNQAIQISIIRHHNRTKQNTNSYNNHYIIKH